MTRAAARTEVDSRRSLLEAVLRGPAMCDLQVECLSSHLLPPDGLVLDYRLDGGKAILSSSLLYV